MGGAIRGRYLGRSRIYDCLYADAHIRDGTYAFGLVRELLIRDCYLADFRRDCQDGFDWVVDLGANRGFFSTMVSSFARRMIAAEPQPAFQSVFRRQMELNGIREWHYAQAFVGSNTFVAGCATRVVSIGTLLDQHGVERVDLLKMDIEGAEFGLFRDPGWLGDVTRLTMEVHPNHGRVRELASVLEDYGFAWRGRDRWLRPTRDPEQVAFMTAFATR